MKSPSIILAAAIAAVASFAVATASATTLTGSGGTTLEVGTTISAESEGRVVLHPPPGEAECNSTISGKTETKGGSTETVKVLIEALSFNNCNEGVAATVLKKGSLEFHTKETSANANGTLTWTGGEWTTEINGFHCIFSTSGTDIGTLTGSSTTGSNATLDIIATITRTGGRSGAFCGSTAQWTGSFKFTVPSTLNVDGETPPAVLEGEASTGNVGETLGVTWKNVGGSTAVVDDETNSDGTIAETVGTGCGTIAASSSCTSRRYKCLKEGEATLTIRDTPSVSGSVTVKCDNPPLAGGPPTGTVGETVTVTWRDNSESAMVIEDETISDATVAETLGSSCGTIAATGSCTSRKIKCLKKGETTITAADTPSTEGKFVIKCD